jgi:hypothetical protein
MVRCNTPCPRAKDIDTPIVSSVRVRRVALVNKAIAAKHAVTITETGVFESETVALSKACTMVSALVVSRMDVSSNKYFVGTIVCPAVFG